jgi:hypothetical protein
VIDRLGGLAGHYHAGLVGVRDVFAGRVAVSCRQLPSPPGQGLSQRGSGSTVMGAKRMSADTRDHLGR